MRILAGLSRPSAGWAKIAGHDIVGDPLAAKQRLAYVPESGALYTLLTGREHLALAAALRGISPTQAQPKIDRLLQLFELGPVIDRRIDTLSKGQKQKVALSTAFLSDAEVLFLDEPLDGLDVTAARALKDLMFERVAQGGAILYSSHILDVVERVCHRAIIIHQGKVVADAPTQTLVARSKDASLESIFHQLIQSDQIEGLAGAFPGPKGKK